MLILYAISPILVHGTELGRPDHQSLLILLVDDRDLRRVEFASSAGRQDGERVAATSAIAWALAIWVSAYEPLVLFLIRDGHGPCWMNRRAVFARIVARDGFCSQR